MFPARTFAGKRVAVFGLARSGTACIEALRLGGAEIHAWDDHAAAVEKARNEDLPVSDLHALDFTRLDNLVLSPGVPLTHPEPHWSVAKARAAGIEIIGDTEVFQRELGGTGARLVAITGTNGKSTTTALTGHLFRSAGRDTEVGGNIGTAVFQLKQPLKARVYVLELSSFQIELTPSLRPDAAILVNITPDHLDRHGTMENYAAVKGRIFTNQGRGDTSIVGVDDDWSARIAESLQGKPDVVPVSVERDIARGVCAPDGVLKENGEPVIDLRDMPALRGTHNWQNACMAFAAAKALGLKTDEIERGMRSFPGLAHRMQEVGRCGAIAFVNDSKATNADAASKALASFGRIHWIAGGIAKAGGIEPLAPFFPKIVRAYLIGQSAGDFAATLSGKVAVSHCGTLEKAVAAASDDACKAEEEAVVLLSPACASFDQYPNFEVRGEAFVRAVEALPGIVKRA